MNWLKKISCFLILLSAMSFSGGNAYAQNVFKLDFSKTPGKFGVWVQKQSENFENAMKEIGESQFATFIGKGVAAAKEGIKFAKEKMDEVKGLYEKVQSGINEVQQSTEYKVATLSAQRLSEQTALDSLKKQQDTEKAVLKSDAEVKKTVIIEKIDIAKENFDVGLKILEDEAAKLPTEEAKQAKLKEIEEYKNANTASIQSLEEELSGIEEDTLEKIKEIDASFEESIAAQTSVINDLDVEISELISQNKREKGEIEDKPEDVIKNAVDDYSFKEGELVTLEARNKKEKTRYKKIENIATSTSGYSANIVAKIEDKKDEESQASATSKTTSGKSEALHTATTQTMAQLDALYEYLLVELKNIELETANILAGNKDYKAGEVKETIDVCDYEIDEKDTSFSFSDVVKGSVDAASSVIGIVEGIKSITKGDDIPAEDLITGLTGM